MWVYSIPTRTRFRGLIRREGILFRGEAGWGEFSPFPQYGPFDSARWLAAAEESAHRGWPSPLRNTVPVNATIPAVDPATAYAMTAASGCRTAKVKVAERVQHEAADIARVRAVRAALGTHGLLRVDANGAWDVDTALRMIKALNQFDLQYVEQPCATLAELAAVRRRTDVPIAADESVRRAEDPLRVRLADAADIVVLKVQPLGGVRAALRVADACGLPVVVSSALETSIGLSAGLALAAALPELPYACGLATLSLLEGDVVADSLVPVDGEIRLRRPVPDEDLLRRSRPLDPAVTAAWYRRMTEARPR
ncbi:o-succinylbenzoate synthase [Streptomyces sp. NPDC127068]|uniref:o-succinylbenzoate synthase n=1 Tax=Streptomyces sp. NPDC127068 TaxID=3347127 RepID=UPI00365AE802